MIKVLLSNDDGVDAPGISSLYEGLQGVADLFVVAPEVNQSGAGSSITTNRPLKVKEYKEKFLSVNGKPSDCVHLGIHELCPWKPDLVISGINLGANMAEDLLYSGTVGAALEARSMSIPSIAVSAAAFEQPGSYGLMEPNFDTAAKVIREILEGINLNDIEPSVSLNINIPNVAYTTDLKKNLTTVGTWGPRNPPGNKQNSKGVLEYWTSHRSGYPENDFNSDISSLERNEISICPLYPNFMANSSSPLKGWVTL
jgi:5'-nucleotidase